MGKILVPDPVVLAMMGDSTMCGRLAAGSGNTIPYVLVALLALRYAPARAPYRDPFLSPLFVVGTELDSGANAASPLLPLCPSNCVPGRLAKWVVDGTDGVSPVPTVAQMISGLSTGLRITHVGCELVANDIAAGHSVEDSIEYMNTLLTQWNAYSSTVKTFAVAPKKTLDSGDPTIHANVDQAAEDIMGGAVTAARIAPVDFSGFTNAHMINSATDAHPSVPASPTLATWTGTVDFTTSGIWYLAARLFERVMSAAVPYLPGDTH